MSWLMNSCNLFKNSLKITTNVQQIRNTFVLKRRHRPLLFKLGTTPRKLTHKYFIYDLVHDSNVLPGKPLKIILTQDVTGYGEKGDLVALPTRKAYKSLLLPGFAVYATPENLKKYNITNDTPSRNTSLKSLFIRSVKNLLTHRLYCVTMSRTEPWVLEPWHIRVTLRKCLFQVPDDAIELPPDEIRGPDPSLQNKLFYVTITLDGGEKVESLCYIQHWPIGNDTTVPTNDALFPDQAAKIAELLVNLKKKPTMSF